MFQPKLEIKKVEDSVYGYALCRSDRNKAICKGITRKHAEHLKKICSRMVELPEEIIPIKDWYDFDTIVEVTPEGYGKVDISVLKM